MTPNSIRTQGDNGVKTVSEVLTAAADLLEPEGAWTQGTFGRPGCQCVLGAIARAAGINPHGSNWSDALTRGAHEYLCQAIGAEWIGGTLWADAWNDAPGRTQVEVVETLRRAASLSLTKEQVK